MQNILKLHPLKQVSILYRQSFDRLKSQYEVGLLTFIFCSSSLRGFLTVKKREKV